jgi:hypothetical protein
LNKCEDFGLAGGLVNVEAGEEKQADLIERGGSGDGFPDGAADGIETELILLVGIHEDHFIINGAGMHAGDLDDTGG